MFIEIQSSAEFEQIRNEDEAVLAYFSTDACNVCKVLKPKVDDLVQSHFPKIKMVYVKTDLLPDIAAAHTVFVAPTILVFFHGREYIRKSRNIALSDLKKDIERPYSLALE